MASPELPLLVWRGGSTGGRARWGTLGDVTTLLLPAPVALARLVDTLTPTGARNLVWQPKWDGYLH